MSSVRADRPPVPRSLLFFAFLGGPVAWTVHLLASYPLVPLACELGTNAPLNAITAGTALVSAAAGLVGWRAHRRLTRDSGPDDGAVAAGPGASGDDVVDTDAAIGDDAAAAPSPGGDAPFDWARFMAVCGALLGAFFVFVILVEGLPPILQDPCMKGL